MKALTTYNILKIFTLLEILTCYLFLFHTNGLLFYDDEGYEYVTNLQSSGSEDNIAFFLVGCLYFLFLVIILMKKWKPSIVLVMLFLIFIIHLLILAIIQMGSVLTTILVDHNAFLLFLMINPIFLLIIAIKYKKQENII